MVQHAFGDSGRFLNHDYYQFRKEARETAVSIDEFSDQEIERYDLETVDFDRKAKEDEFVTGPSPESEGSAKSGVDIRTIPTIRF